MKRRTFMITILQHSLDLYCDTSGLRKYRFERGEGLEGYSLGNLLLTALTDLKGDLMEANKKPIALPSCRKTHVRRLV